MAKATSSRFEGSHEGHPEVVRIHPMSTLARLLVPDGGKVDVPLIVGGKA